MVDRADYYIGLMSGTSVDAVDVAIVDLADDKINCIAAHTHPFPSSLRQAVLQLANNETNHIEVLARTDVLLGRVFAEAVQCVLKKAKLKAAQITAIGSHGQTVRHCPHDQIPFTMQIGDPNVIAALTGITTVADFRRKDIAHGGQGAPLAPVFHRALFNQHQPLAVVNIGGMANLTYLPAQPEQPVMGFDTGPGNVLLDQWYHRHHRQPFDRDGAWAATGRCDKLLLQQLLADAYFQQPPPKSTGREYFNLAWLDQALQRLGDVVLPQDVQATLVNLTTQSIADAVKQFIPEVTDVVIAGGGVHNQHLINTLTKQLSHYSVKSIQTYHIDPDALEAMMFAWLAKQTLAKQNLDLTSITGGQRSSILGGILLFLITM